MDFFIFQNGMESYGIRIINEKQNQVMVLGIDKENERISLIEQVHADPWTTVAVGIPGSIVKGVIIR